MKKDRKSEYMIIAVINIMFVFYTNIFMHGAPYAWYDFFAVHAYFSVLGWALYAGSMYLVLIWSGGNFQNKVRHLGTVLVIGIGTGIVKTIIDVLTNHLLTYIVRSNIISTTVMGVRNGMFGFLFIFFLFRYFSEKKCQLLNTAKKQEKAVAAVIVFYILTIITIQIKEAFYIHTLETEDFMNLFMSMVSLGIDEVNFANRWFLAVFMTTSWWLMQGYYGGRREAAKEDIPQ